MWTPGGKLISVDNESPKFVPADLVFLRELAESGALQPVSDRTYPLEEMVEAHRYGTAGIKRGMCSSRRGILDFIHAPQTRWFTAGFD